MSEVIYRPMTADDLDAVTALEVESFSRPWQREDFVDALTKPHYLYYVAEADDTVVATSGLIISPDEADISNVAVNKDYRRRGIAATLLKTLMDAGRTRGIRSYTLEVRSRNEAAIRLYEKLGFVHEGTRRNFYTDPVDDALIYWLRGN